MSPVLWSFVGWTHRSVSAVIMLGILTPSHPRTAGRYVFSSRALEHMVGLDELVGGSQAELNADPSKHHVVKEEAP